MNEKVVNLFETEKYEVVTPEYLADNIMFIHLSNIELDVPTYLNINDNDNVKMQQTDFSNPLVLKKDSDYTYSLYINHEFYLANKEQIDSLLCYLVSKVNNIKLSICDKDLINDNLIDSLCKNKNLKELDLGEYYGDESYILKHEDYLKFKSSTIKEVKTNLVDDKLKSVFDSMITCNMKKKLIGKNTYLDLNDQGYFCTLQDALSEEELENFKYIHKDVVIKISGETVFDLEKICNKLKEFNKTNKIKIEVKDKEEFNKFILSRNIDYKNIDISFNSLDSLFLDTYIKLEKTLYQFIEPAKYLSPFEKYIYVYNITKKFKEYKESDIEPFAARNLYSVLRSEYIVCVGFSNLFGDLLDKLGIKNMYLSNGVDTSYDDINKLEDFEESNKVAVRSGHARRYIYLVDEKYDIDGFYIADPTWDNDLKEDYYNHLIMTDREASCTKRYSFIDKKERLELFNVNSLEEFYEKINFYIKKDQIKKYCAPFLVEDIINNIKPLDPIFINNLYKKYNIVDKYSYPDDLSNIIFDLGNYIVSHVNKNVSGDTIMKAVEVIYRHSYGYSEEVLEDKLNEVRQKNKERHDKLFPKRYKMYADGNSEIYDNETNKFDIEENTSNKVL